jgi:hypothetical protein
VSYTPDAGIPFARIAIEYFKLAPKKLAPGAQTAFVYLVLGETTGLNPCTTAAHPVTTWARRCRVEERQMSDAINDAIERGIVMTWPPIDPAKPRNERPKRVAFYIPEPAAWAAAPDVPKAGPKLVKAPIIDIEDPQADDAEVQESRNRLQDSQPCQSWKIRANAVIYKKLPEATRDIGYENRTGQTLDVGIVPRLEGGYVLRITGPDKESESRNRLQDSSPPKTPESRNRLQDSAPPELDRDALKRAVQKLLRPAYYPDAEAWRTITKALGTVETPNELYLEILKNAAKRYRGDVGAGLQIKLARQARDAHNAAAALAAERNEEPAPKLNAEQTALLDWIERNGHAWTTTAEYCELLDRYESEGK